MTEQKQPQAGEWWEKEDTRVCVIGTKKNGLTVGEMQSGTLIPFMSIYGWRHLPDCDSFDWQPEVWPKWYVAGASVYRRNSKTESYLICDDGREVKQCCPPETYDAKWCFTEITEAEALARVKPEEVYPQPFTQEELTASYQAIPAADLPPVESPDEYRILGDDEQTVATDERMYPDGYCSWTAMTAMNGWESGITVKALRAKFMSWHNVVVRRKVVPPVESPDDWVTQDRVPPRHGIDQVQWSDWESSRWINPTCGWYPPEIHGYRDEYDDTVLSVRCRRKDLPPQPQPKRVTVRLVCSTETIGVVNWRMHDDPGIAGEAEIRHDGYKFYVEVQP